MTQSTAQPLPKIVLFGDSLTEWSFFRDDGKGFGDVLTERYKGRAEVLNEGYAGYTTATLKQPFEQLLSKLETNGEGPAVPPPLLLTVFLGANDATLTWAHVPLAEYVANLRSFVDQALAKSALSPMKVMLITPPPINVREWVPTKDVGLDDDDDDDEEEKEMEEAVGTIGFRTWLSKLRYAKAVMSLASEYSEKGEARVVGLDLWRAFINYGLVEQGKQKLEDDAKVDEDMVKEKRLPGCGLPRAKAFGNGVFADGLHFDGLGYEVLNNAFFRLVEEKWPELA